ncbi:Multimerin-2 [Merluccius polli]|uniref:Multimerin-2 n=1 Tax=Merluccius polli TaxID=89951 RepID=A0AA47NV44_MERPO|nr:Multimerin-2 [Merluccius polli]
MRAVGGLVVVVVLLVRTHCEVRARDPGEEENIGGAGGAAGVLQQQELLLADQQDQPEITRPPGPGSQRPPKTIPARTGNWCAFVQQRVVSSVVKCGTEKYTIRSPCPPNTPHCQLVMYQLSSRPVYRQHQQVFTTLQWRCCPGHSGDSCQDSAGDQVTHSDSVVIGPAELGMSRPTHRLQTHNFTTATMTLGTHKFTMATMTLGTHKLTMATMTLGTHNFTMTTMTLGTHNFTMTTMTLGTHKLTMATMTLGTHKLTMATMTLGTHKLTMATTTKTEPRVLTSIVSEASLLVPAVAALVLAQLNPIMESFNRSLILLDWRVEELARDLAQLSPGGKEGGVLAASGCSEIRLEEVEEEMLEVRQLLDSQRTALEERLHSQHAMLHHNLTSFKTGVDVKLKHTGRMMQVRHAYRLPEGCRKEKSQLVGDLRRTLQELDERISQARRDSRIQFMETGLEVGAAREVVLGRLREMERNVSLVAQQAEHRDTDLEYLFPLVYNCTALKDEVERLERGMADLVELANEKWLTLEGGVTNLTELANENRLVLEERGQWGGHWEPLVKELQLSLQQSGEKLCVECLLLASQVKDSLAAEQIGDMKDQIRLLSSYFDSLMNDVIRHNEILKILQGEEVSVFLQWPLPEQKAYSIPALKEQMKSLQEELRHNLRSSALQSKTVPMVTKHYKSAGGERVEPPMVDQPLPPGEGEAGSHPPRREQQLLIAPDPADGGGALKKEVEELEVRVQALEEGGGGAQEEQLQEEVLWLRRAVEDHLRVFKKVFTQAETLEDSHRSLNLQDLWTLTQHSRRERRRGGERRTGDKDGEKDGEVGRGTLRSRRDATASPPRRNSPLLLATSLHGLRSDGGFLVFRASLNVGGVYSEMSGHFTAPHSGLYLLLLTLDLRPGHAHLLLRRGSGEVLCLLQEEVMEETGALSFLRLLHLEKEEQLSVELRAGGLQKSSSNALAVMLLH